MLGVKLGSHANSYTVESTVLMNMAVNMLTDIAILVEKEKQKDKRKG